MASIRVNRNNPDGGLDIEVSDEALLQLFMDVAALKAGFALACTIGIGLMVSGFSVLAALIVVL